MRDQRTRSFTRSVCCLSAAAFWLIVTAGAAPAQQSDVPKGPPPGGPNLKAAARERELRETRLRNMDLAPSAEKRDQRRIDEAVEQVRQDFKQIQVIRNELVRVLLAEKPIDYKVISDKTGQIHKIAGRLKTYLLPSDAEDKDKGDKDHKDHAELDNGEMKGALIQLCNQIVSFIENPVLKTPGTVDVEQSTRAGSDLLGIIKLSHDIKRSAERLNHPPK